MCVRVCQGEEAAGSVKCSIVLFFLFFFCFSPGTSAHACSLSAPSIHFHSPKAGRTCGGRAGALLSRLGVADLFVAADKRLGRQLISFANLLRIDAHTLCNHACHTHSCGLTEVIDQIISRSREGRDKMRGSSSTTGRRCVFRDMRAMWNKKVRHGAAAKHSWGASRSPVAANAQQEPQDPC